MNEPIFPEYDRLKKEHKEQINLCVRLLDRLRTTTLKNYPGSSKMKDVVTNCASSSNKFLDNLITTEEITKKLTQIQELELVYKTAVNIKRQELEQSKHPLDLLYRYRFIERTKVVHIAPKLGYTREYIYELIKKIEGMI